MFLFPFFSSLHRVGEKVSAIGRRGRGRRIKYTEEQVKAAMTIWREAHDDWNFRMSLSTKLSHEAVFDRHRARLEQWGVASAEMFKAIIQAWQARQRRNLAKQRGR